LWRQNKWLIIAGLTVIVVQTGLIAALLLQRARRRRSEAALRSSEARNSAILRMVPDLMFIMSRDGVYLDYHARDSRDLFVPPEQFLGKGFREIFPAELAEQFSRSFSQALNSNEPVIVEYSLTMPGGERHYETRLLKCDNDVIMSIVRDVTAKRTAEEELHKAQAELAKAGRVRMLGELTAGIAHEVSQPLAAIVTNARACLRHLDSQSEDLSLLQDALHDVVADGRRAHDVITRIRGLARQAPLERKPLAVNGVIDDVVTLCGRMLRGRRVMLNVDLSPNLPGVVGDRIQLQQVLLNLILNAADAMDSVTDRARLLTIRSASSNGHVTVSVRDSGPGLDPSDLNRVFTPFFTTKVEGMGVGLSISRSILEAHGGNLELKRNAPDGATFEFFLPASPPGGVTGK
jgi:PAS domain S-box-containing protein